MSIVFGLQKIIESFGWEKSLLVISAILYIFSFLIFFPSTYASIDEHGYLYNSVKLANGSLGEPSAEYAPRSIFNGEEYISNRFIGKSLFLLPFLFLGLIGVMFSGLVIHLLNFFILTKILDKVGVKKIFAVIYLLIPTFVWASRTLYPGLLVLTFFLLTFYFYLSNQKKHWVFAGFFAGLAVIVRNDAVIAVLALALTLLFLNPRKLYYFVVGGIPLAIFLLIFNNYLFGGPLSVGSGGVFSLLFNFPSSMLQNILIYSVFLLFYLPLLLVSPFLENKTKLKYEFIAFSIAYLYLNSLFTNFLAFDFSIDTLFTSRLRYLIPLLGILLIPYAALLELFFGKISAIKNNLPKVWTIIIIVLFIGTFFASSIHSNFLNEKRKSVSDLIYSNTPDNSLILGSSDDRMFFIKDFFPTRKYYGIDLAGDLGGNPENIDPIGELKAAPESYLLLIDYSNLANNTSQRGELVKLERKIIFDFYEKNKDSFDLVVKDETISFWLYKYNNGPLK